MKNRWWWKYDKGTLKDKSGYNMRRIENGDIINKDGYKVGSYSDSKNVATSGYF